MSLSSYIILFGLAIFGIHFWLQTKSYIFQHEEVSRIAKRHAGNDKNIRAMFTKIALDLEKKYPGHILPEESRQWQFVNAGGWMGSMYLLHASLTEYVLFFGTAVDTQGHSGLYWANISDTVLAGSLRQWKDGTLESQVYGAGDLVLHGWGEVAAVQFSAGTWMVEYGRGFVPSTLGFALWDSIFSTLDFVSASKLIAVYAKALVRETAFQVQEMIETLKKNMKA